MAQEAYFRDSCPHSGHGKSEGRPENGVFAKYRATFLIFLSLAQFVIPDAPDFFPLHMRLGEVLVMENPPQTDFSGLGLPPARAGTPQIWPIFGPFAKIGFISESQLQIHSNSLLQISNLPKKIQKLSLDLPEKHT